MAEHIPAHDNADRPIVAAGNPTVPLVYFNRVRLAPGESHDYRLAEHESCVVPLDGACTVTVDGERFEGIGTRRHLWEGVPNAVYVPRGAECTVEADAGGERVELFVAGGRCEEAFEPFAMRDEDVVILPRLATPRIGPEHLEVLADALVGIDTEGANA